MDADGGKKDITDAMKKTTEGAIHACRWWYDEQKYAKPFCCQMVELGTLDADKKYTMDEVKATAVIDGTSTSSSEPVDISATEKVTPGAETFNGAVQVAATAVTALAATIAMY